MTMMTRNRTISSRQPLDLTFNRLTKLKVKTKILSDFYVFDTETGVKKKNGDIHWELNPRPERFQFGVIYGRNFTKVIKSRKQFIEELKDPRYKDKYVFAHNAEYDLTALYGNVYDVDREAIFNGKFISAKNGNCWFADSLNIYKTRAAVIGEMLGIEKKKLGNRKGKLISKGGISQNDINYCIRDCEIIWEALFRIFEKAGSQKITQASLSMEYFRRFHLEKDILHNNNTKFFFDSYFGGRCEAFVLGKVNGYVRDVNSMYPWAMVNAKFPNPAFLKVTKNVSVKQFKSLYLKKFEGMAYCRVRHKETWLGYLPIIQNSKLIFPVGEFSGAWNFNELRYAIKSGVVEILSIDKVVYAPPMDSPFVKYVNSLYAERQASENEFEVYVIKIFMNSLYGKLAQRIKEQFVYIADMDKEIESIRRYQKEGVFIKLVPFSETRKDAFLVTKQLINYAAAYSIPSFASYVTSHARVHLLQELVKTGPKRVLYCDTDSIFFAGPNSFADEKQLGGWKLEEKKITRIDGLKNYRYKFKKDGKWITKRRLKGVPENAIEVEKHLYRYTNLVKTRESMRRGLEPGTPTDRTKRIKGTYNKRVVLKNGKTKPIKL